MNELGIAREPRVLLWDIETSQSIGSFFDMYEPRIGYEDIFQEWFIITIAWKWLGQKTIHGVKIKEPCEDKEIIQTVHDVISKADAIIGHNGDKFDIKKFNARAIVHGIPPLPPIVQIDTLKMARSKFKFTCNRLDYIGQLLGVGRKVETEKGLWHKVLRGDKRAISNMLKYNKGDVQLLEDVYLKLKPYCPAHINLNIYHNTDDECPSCGEHALGLQGFKRNKTRKVQQLKCKSCGSWCTKPLRGVAR